MDYSRFEGKYNFIEEYSYYDADFDFLLSLDKDEQIEYSKYIKSLNKPLKKPYYKEYEVDVTYSDFIDKYNLEIGLYLQVEISQCRKRYIEYIDKEFGIWGKMTRRTKISYERCKFLVENEK